MRYLTFALVLTIFAAASALGQNNEYVLMVDNTGSLRPQFPIVVSLGKGIVERARERGPVLLVNFETDGVWATARTGVDWSQDANDFKRHLDQLKVVPGQTPLLHAIEAILGEFETRAKSQKNFAGERLIILVTDGEDRTRYSIGMTTSEQIDREERNRKVNQLVKRMKALGIKIYAVGLTSELDTESSLRRISTKEKAEKLLTKLSKDTGGRAIFPPKKVDVDAVLAELFPK